MPTRAHRAVHDSPRTPTNHSAVVVGDADGDALGLVLGETLGLPEGLADGEALGDPDGEMLGLTVGDFVGDGVGHGPLQAVQPLSYSPPSYVGVPSWPSAHFTFEASRNAISTSTIAWQLDPQVEQPPWLYVSAAHGMHKSSSSGSWRWPAVRAQFSCSSLLLRSDESGVLASTFDWKARMERKRRTILAMVLLVDVVVQYGARNNASV